MDTETTKLEKLAREAGGAELAPSEFVMSAADLSRFADLVRQEERERCAKLMDDMTHVERESLAHLFDGEVPSSRYAAAIRSGG
jgi:hypothetical protein